MNNRIGWLDGLRAYAIALVVLVHSSLSVDGLPTAFETFARSGQYGVQLFFVISSITIYMTLERSNNVMAWLSRRFFRIAPLNYVAIVFYGLWLLAWPSSGGNPTLQGWFSAAAINAVFLNAWVPSAMNIIIPGGWSIAVEMMFYLAAPWLVFSLRKRRISLLLLAFIAVDALIITAIAGGSVPNNSFFYFWPLTQAPVFLTGLAYVNHERGWLFGDEPRRLPHWFGYLALFAGIALGLICGVGLELSHNLAPAAMGCGFVGLVSLARQAWSPAFSNVIATSIGRVSFSIYITHFAIIRIMRDFTDFHQLLAPWPLANLLAAFTVALAVSFLVSAVTFRVIEVPGNRLGKWVSARIEDRAIRGSRS